MPGACLGPEVPALTVRVVTSMADLVEGLRAAGALSVARYEPRGVVHTLMPTGSGRATADLVSRFPRDKEASQSRTETTVLVTDAHEGEVKVHVTIEANVVDALRACVMVLTTEAGGSDRLDAWEAAFAGRPHGLLVEEARLELLAFQLLDPGEFGSDFVLFSEEARLAVDLLLADYVCTDELLTMGHCIEAVVRHREAIAAARALSRLDEADRRRLSVRPVSAAGPESRALS